jgi:PPOX class probable F420-dependent enzyme
LPEVSYSDGLETLPGWARALLDSEPVGHLGLLDDDGYPRVLPVTFVVVGTSAWSAIDDKPKRVPAEELARVRWLRARSSSALTVDRYADDWTRLAWVQLLGRTTIVDVAGHPAVVDALASRYPQYRSTPPGGPLLRLDPRRCVWWRAQRQARQ